MSRGCWSHYLWRVRQHQGQRRRRSKPTNMKPPSQATRTVRSLGFRLYTVSAFWRRCVQDIAAFLSCRLANDCRDQPLTLQDDLEPEFWVLLWIALAYLDSSLCQWELHRFMAATLGRKSDVDDSIQKSVVANKLSGRGLFLDYPLLKRLLLDLARLFRDHSDTSSPGEHTRASGLWKIAKSWWCYRVVQALLGAGKLVHRQTMRMHALRPFPCVWPVDAPVKVRYLGLEGAQRWIWRWNEN